MKRSAYIPLLLLLILAIFIFVRYTQNYKKTEQKFSQLNKQLSMKITSPAFENNQSIPPKYTCNGENINPPLEFSDVPPDTKSLVLIVDDPDAPMGTWVHWVIYNIDPSVRTIEENSIPQNGIQVNTSFGKPGYGGPCPPSGTHRYFFKLYALNKMLTLDENPSKQTVENAMKDSIIAKAELVGLYNQHK